MTTIYFSLPGNETLTAKLTKDAKAESGQLEIRHFPDGESYVRVFSDVKNKQAVIVCTLHRPDSKLLPLHFLSKTLRSLGAANVCLIAPYLAYMRQDKVFNPGEGLTSSYFANLVSGLADKLITIDPHLHRIASLKEIYSIPTITRNASLSISTWIKTNIDKPLIIGPDSESEQWVSEVAKNSDAPFVVLQKTRYGDSDVKTSIPEIEKFKDLTPVLVDDIISTARTMIETVGHLKKLKMKTPVCIGIHAIFAGNAFEELKMAGAGNIVTCNTISHPSNRIDISNLLRLT